MIKNTSSKLRAFSIKPIFLNISLHFGRNQIPHRLPFFNQLSDLRRRDIEKRDFSKKDPVAGEMDPGSLSGVISKVPDQGLWKRWRRNVFLRPWPGHHNKVTKRKEILEVLPGLNLTKGVPAQDEEKGILMSLSKKSDGVDGERSPRP
jgi:hypothetical protein